MPKRPRKTPARRIAPAGARTKKARSRRPKHNEFSRAVGRALRRAAKRAREVARLHGTPLYIWESGKVVAIKP